jgi:hypothetical protein
MSGHAKKRSFHTMYGPSIDCHRNIPWNVLIDKLKTPHAEGWIADRNLKLELMTPGINTTTGDPTTVGEYCVISTTSNLWKLANSGPITNFPTPSNPRQISLSGKLYFTLAHMSLQTPYRLLTGSSESSQTPHRLLTDSLPDPRSPQGVCRESARTPYRLLGLLTDSSESTRSL